MNPDDRSYPNRHFVLTFLGCSIAFGLLMGAVFPFYTRLFVRFPSAGASQAFAAGCLVAGLLVGLASFFIAKLFILRVIDLLSRKIASLTKCEGELSHDIPLCSSDSIGRLILSFNRFQAKIRQIMSSLGAMTEKTEVMGLELAANSTETSAASSQIARHMEQILAQTVLLTDEAKSVDSARLNIAESVTVVTNNVELQAAALTKLSKLIEDSVGEIKQISLETNRKIDAIKQTVLLSSRAVEEMAIVVRKMSDIYTKASDIGNMITSIEDIAQQINILGVNAAIEASHSGELGQGFGVVASEIRSLSELSGRRSTSITESVNSVVNFVHEGVALSSTTETNLKTFLDRIALDVDGMSGVSRVVADLLANAEKMLAAYNDLVETTIKVHGSVMDVDTDSRSIEGSLRTLLKTADGNREAVDEVSSAISDIAAEVKSLNQISETNAENVRVLRGEVGKFRDTA